jgi:hypothetical protein
MSSSIKFEIYFTASLDRVRAPIQSAISEINILQHMPPWLSWSVRVIRKYLMPVKCSRICAPHVQLVQKDKANESVDWQGAGSNCVRRGSATSYYARD